MFGLYTEKDVKKLVGRLREEYEELLTRRRGVEEELKEQNRTLQARVLALESERSSVSEALVHAVAEGERIKKECRSSADSERRELVLLGEKCRLLSEKLLAKYPDQEDVASFSAFVQTLNETLGDEPPAEEESGFNMDDVLNPKHPLDLGKLCKELDLMEEDE